jgi:hypothetical protein
MAPTVYVSDMASNPNRSHLHPDTLDDLLGESLQATCITLTRSYIKPSEFIQSPQEIL